jgi:hypothetical protein
VDRGTIVEVRDMKEEHMSKRLVVEGRYTEEDHLLKWSVVRVGKRWKTPYRRGR